MSTGYLKTKGSELLRQVVEGLERQEIYRADLEPDITRFLSLIDPQEQGEAKPMSIRKGDLVIIGESDSPRPQNMALVTKDAAGMHPYVEVRYIARRMLSQCAKQFLKPWRVNAMCLTKVQTFGVDVIGIRKNDIDEWFVDVRHHRPSEAKYEDGVPRRWDDDGRACVITDQMVGIVLSTVGAKYIPLNYLLNPSPPISTLLAPAEGQDAGGSGSI